MTQTPKVVKIVSTLGIIPFLLGAFAVFNLPILSPELNKFLINVSILYGSLILTFLGGCLFGFECLSNSGPNNTRIWVAVSPAFIALLALLTSNFSASILAVGFLLVFNFDRRFHIAGVVPKWWLSLRLPLTTIVIISLSIIGFFHEN